MHSEETKRKISIAKTGAKIFKTRGENNCNWKGDQVGNKALHKWIRRNHPPKKDECMFCLKETNKLDLANMTGVYDRDRSNYMYLCESCHTSYDHGK